MARPQVYGGRLERPCARPEYLPLPDGFRRVQLLSLDLALDLALPLDVGSGEGRGSDGSAKLRDMQHSGHDGGYEIPRRGGWTEKGRQRSGEVARQQARRRRAQTFV